MAYEEPLITSLIGGGTWSHSCELKPGDFSDPLCAQLFRAILELRAEGSPVEPQGISERVEPAAWLLFLKLSEQLGDPSNADWYAKKVYLSSRLRLLKQSLRAVSEETDFRSALERLEALVQSLAAQEPSKGFVHVKDLAEEHISQLRNQGFAGLETGLPQLDGLLLGLKPGHVYALGGRTSNGKTMLALLVAYLLAKNGTPVAYFLLETTGRALAARPLGWASGAPTLTIQRGDFNGEKEWGILENGAKTLALLPLYIDDAQDLSVNNMLPRFIQARESLGAKLAVVDHLTLVRSKGSDPRQEALAISRGAVRAAKDSQLPVILLSQFSRKAAYERPAVTHFKESGSIEEDSDVCILVYRHAELPQQEKWFQDFKSKVSEMAAFNLFNPAEEEIIWVEVAKNRPNGRLGLIPYALNRKYGTLREC